METFLFEATHDAAGTGNWGKFMAAVPDSEWRWRSQVDGWPGPLLRKIGWGNEHLWVQDLQTGEGLMLRAGGSAPADLSKHQVWVCPLFEPWLAWLHSQLRGSKDILATLTELPQVVYLPDAEFAFAGYRRRKTCVNGWPV